MKITMVNNMTIQAESKKIEVEITNKLGLHARAAAKLSKLASSFTDCDITIAHNDKSVNAKSIMGILFLAAGKGKKLTIEVTGQNADHALQSLIDLVTNKFDESE
jgi:phosphocarrier protein HPr